MSPGRNVLRIHLLGSFAVLGGGGPIAGAATQPRRTAVLALVARAGERGIRRDKIAALLWPDSDEERGRRLLAKALSALRQALGDQDVFTGVADIRLNLDVATCDLLDFEAAVRRADLAAAASLYEGPFLDGFRLPGAPEFERWVEMEQATLAHRYADLLVRLAGSAAERRDHQEAIGWLRKLSATDPLNSRHTLKLMQALVAAGDRSGALRQAQIYEALLEQELDLPPDRDVVELARRLRADANAQAPTPQGSTVPRGTNGAPRGEEVGPPVASPRAHQPTADEGWSEGARNSEADAERARNSLPNAIPAIEPDRAVEAPQLVTANARGTRRVPRGAWVGAAVVAGAVFLVAGVAWERFRARAAAPQPIAVVAVGHIADYRRAAQREAGELAKPLTDMLATNLARAPGVSVVSTARMYELLAQVGGADTVGTASATAARRAGAAELLDGALFDLGEGKLRLDLRRIDLATGAVRQALSVTGADAFALADSGTAQLVRALGGRTPSGSVADVTTRSLVAYRLYEQGLRAFYRNEIPAATRLFDAALAEDSTFAMAAYYAAQLPRAQVDSTRPYFQRAVRLADRASDRERLLIRAMWAWFSSSPDLRTFADSLAARFPQDVEGHLLTGVSLAQEGSYLAAVPYLNRAVRLDSTSLGGGRARCLACEALGWLVQSYHLADSLAAAEREARRWTRLEPQSSSAWVALADMLALRGKRDEALAALRNQERIGALPVSATDGLAAEIRIQLGAYEEADSILRRHLDTAPSPYRERLHWTLAISLLNQGRLVEALAMARRRRVLEAATVPAGSAPYVALLEAQTLFEMGRYEAAAALFDSVARVPSPSDAPSARARHRAWALTHVATALAAAGDTTRLRALVDTVQLAGARSGYGRDHRLHHYVRGLLLTARGHDAQAIEAFSAAISSRNLGYTRANYEMARLLLAAGRPRDAVEVLQPSLRGSFEASNLYVTRTEIHELLAQAWNSLGSTPISRDSARVHYEAVAHAWRRADPPFATRAQAAARRLQALAT